MVLSLILLKELPERYSLLSSLVKELPCVFYNCQSLLIHILLYPVYLLNRTYPKCSNKLLILDFSILVVVEVVVHSGEFLSSQEDSQL